MTILWCGEPRKPLTEIEKLTLLYQHEANRAKFFGDLKGMRSNLRIVRLLTRK